MNYSRKSYYILLPYVFEKKELLHILLKDGECVCRTSENCKSLVLQDKANIEII